MNAGRLRLPLLTAALVAAAALTTYGLLGLSQWRAVERVIDGDTIVLRGGERVRLIGVDAAELKDPDGPRAKECLRDILGDDRVRLEYGPQRRDRFGRTLAYVETKDAAGHVIDLNESLILSGCAAAMTRYPHPRMEKFLLLMDRALRARRGHGLQPGEKLP